MDEHVRVRMRTWLVKLYSMHTVITAGLSQMLMNLTELKISEPKLQNSKNTQENGTNEMSLPVRLRINRDCFWRKTKIKAQASKIVLGKNIVTKKTNRNETITTMEKKAFFSSKTPSIRIQSISPIYYVQFLFTVNNDWALNIASDEVLNRWRNEYLTTQLNSQTET